ncbi:MAG: helix-turn-helix transcriptional regulator [Clostridia bacterium]|nr:helix-turn-helix transcriptional regulator [Clostridia bacterium]
MSTEEFECFARRLKELRAVEGLTQKELSKRLNISRSCLANYELCTRRPDDDIIRSVAEYFSVTVGYLLGKKEVFYSIGDASDKELDYSDIISVDGMLDVSKLSAVGKIALIEFYNYLAYRFKGNKVGIAKVKYIADSRSETTI